MDASSIIALVVSVGSLLVSIGTMIINLIISLNEEKSKRLLEADLRNSDFRKSIWNESIKYAEELTVKTSFANIENIVNETIAKYSRENTIDPEHILAINAASDKIRALQFNLTTRLSLLETETDYNKRNEKISNIDLCCACSIGTLATLQEAYVKKTLKENYSKFGELLKEVEESNKKLLLLLRDNISGFEMFRNGDK